VTKPAPADNPANQDSQRAVFLSYASEDASAAARICATLRAAGIEVWFDQSELRGGDAWDAAIRKQIKSCALFIPIISKNSDVRVEGYFRLEWKLAVDRSHLMVAEKPFLLPVVVDGTHGANARVPDKFREIQWTPLPSGETGPAFVERVMRLLSPAAEPAPDRPPIGAAPAARAPSAGASRQAIGNQWSSWRSKRALLLILASIVLAGGFFAAGRFVLSQRSAAPRPVPAPEVQSAPPGQNSIPEKSIAVLPFVDMSEKKDQEYFSDGLTEELLDLLAQVPDLRVSARTSSFYFKGRSVDIATIAQKLRVAQVLEGSVRKSGNTIRVTAQLIRAENGYHLWSKTYDRDVKDLFKVQDEIAAAVVAALKSKLLPAQQASNSHRDVDPEAHNQYLLGQQFLMRFNGQDARRAAQAFRKATALDPGYAAAWAGLGDAMFWVGDDEESTAAIEADRHEALAAADRAVALQPTMAYGYLIRGLTRSVTQWDFAGGGVDFRRAVELEPDNSDVLMNYAGAVLVPTGRIDEAVAALHKATEADPLNARVWSWLGFSLIIQGKLGAAREALNRSLEISPEQTYTPDILATSFLLEGDAASALKNSQRSTSEVFRLCGAALAQYDLGNRQESQQQLDQLIAKYGFAAAAQIAGVYAWRGDMNHAFEWLERAHAQHDAGFIYIKVNPLFRKLKGDARYTTMLRAANLQ
jgi:TolB-like protein/cytochrome c-type biogenesis protein CcmH/NrfG